MTQFEKIDWPGVILMVAIAIMTIGMVVGEFMDQQVKLKSIEHGYQQDEYGHWVKGGDTPSSR